MPLQEIFENRYSVIEFREISGTYCIVENFGGRKHWRIWQIKQRFAKVLPSKFYQNVLEVYSDYWCT